MCIEQDKECFSFSQRDKQPLQSKLPLLLMHEAAEVQQKMKEHQNKRVKETASTHVHKKYRKNFFR